LAEVCNRWEQTAQSSEIATMIIRIGMVLDGQGGALSKMLPIFKLGLGGKLGSGKQYVSWIHLEDLVKIILWGIDNESATGIYNGVAPAPLTNHEFTKALGKALHRPTVLPAPSPFVKLMLGELSTLLLSGQRVVPQKLLDSGFKFTYPDINSALQNICPKQV